VQTVRSVQTLKTEMSNSDQIPDSRSETMALGRKVACSLGKEASTPHRGFNVLLLGNAFLLVVFLDTSLGRFLFLHDANEACNLPSNAIADATAAKEICRRGDHE
jgi:hypothetical protein